MFWSLLFFLKSVWQWFFMYDLEKNFAITNASSLLPFFGTRLRRQNFNLAPTQYRQLLRLTRPWRLKLLALCPEHPNRDQNPKFTPLSETTSIPVCFIWESPPPPPRGIMPQRSKPTRFFVHRGKRWNARQSNIKQRFCSSTCFNFWTQIRLRSQRGAYHFYFPLTFWTLKLLLSKKLKKLYKH